MGKMKRGVITGVHDSGSMWFIDAKDSKGKIHEHAFGGDWRPMRDGLDSAFDISSPEFPYTSQKKIYENVIGQEIEYSDVPCWEEDAGWRPTGRKKFSLKVDEAGKIHKLKKVV
jgi:hypothetical protein